jgi:hypothetical protein
MKSDANGRALPPKSRYFLPALAALRRQLRFLGSQSVSDIVPQCRKLCPHEAMAALLLLGELPRHFGVSPIFRGVGHDLNI